MWQFFIVVSSSGLEHQGTQWITFMLSCFSTWSDASPKFCDVILRSGLLFSHIKAVNTLRRDTESEVCWLINVKQLSSESNSICACLVHNRIGFGGQRSWCGI